MEKFGFVLQEEKYIEELGGTMFFYKHKKTDAELVWLNRDSENKTFCVGFQTLPSDDTGVFHILEHSVLCGSEKYPVKEPFVELLKGSMNTFLNAMTFPDKTIYPVSSRNGKDFMNMLRVYLDAVFHPNILKNPNIFYQEGWHYEFDEKDNASIVGVVYGEMKGAMSSEDEIMENKICSMLFKNSPYRFNSGGDPIHIPDLTYEKFLEQYHRFYHPSNSKFFLDGTMSIDEVLSELDQELSRFEKKNGFDKLSYQTNGQIAEDSVYYELEQSESIRKRYHFVMGKILGNWADIEKMTALDIIFDYLAGTNSAPLTRALLEKNLCQDVFLDVQDGIAQPFMLMQVKNCQKKDLKKINQVIREEIQNILLNGLDKRELIASINQMEFASREPREPFGVELAIKSYKSWMYGGDPSLYLSYASVFQTLREKLDTNYYSELIKEVFLDDNGLATLYAIPSKTLGKEKAKEEKELIIHNTANISYSEKQKIKNAQADLQAWHESEDKKEDLDTIPHITLEDMSKEPKITSVSVKKENDMEVIVPNVKTNGTTYLNLFFALPKVSREKLALIATLASILIEFPTENYDRKSIIREVKTYIGGLSFNVVVSGDELDNTKAKCYFCCSCSALETNLEKALSLIYEILFKADFHHEDILKEILNQSYNYMKQELVSSGHKFASLWAASGYSARDYALEQMEGLSYYYYLENIVKSNDFASLAIELEATLKEILQYPFTLGIIGNMEDKLQNDMLAKFHGGEVETSITIDACTDIQETKTIPASIAYAVLGSNFKQVNAEYHGSFALAAKIISLNYLWNEVRVKGGAYGCGMVVRRNGGTFCYSYRDPNPKRSLDIYKESANFLRDFCRNRSDYQGLLIGTIGDLDPLLPSYALGRMAIGNYLRGYTAEMQRKLFKELLETSYDDLMDFADILDKLSNKSSTVVIGGEQIIDGCK